MRLKSHTDWRLAVRPQCCYKNVVHDLAWLGDLSLVRIEITISIWIFQIKILVVSLFLSRLAGLCVSPPVFTSVPWIKGERMSLGRGDLARVGWPFFNIPTSCTIKAQYGHWPLDLPYNNLRVWTTDDMREYHTRFPVLRDTYGVRYGHCDYHPRLYFLHYIFTYNLGATEP